MLDKSKLLICTLLLSACAHEGGSSVPDIGSNWQEAKVSGPVTLRLKGEAGRVEKSQYTYHSLSESFEDGVLRTQKDESAEFLAQTETLGIDAAHDGIQQSVVTSNKVGGLNLSDFAMPEVGERLDMVTSGVGKILQVRGHQANTLYYVPTISLPDDAVEIGDTWTFETSWLTPNQVPLHMEMVTILKGYWACGKNDQCADLDMSGEVTIEGDPTHNLGFQSHWTGRLLFARQQGSVIWSRVNSEETWQTDNVARNVRSCLETSMIQPADYQVAGAAKNKCSAQSLAKTPAPKMP
jgi:hypothetical protein